MAKFFDDSRHYLPGDPEMKRYFGSEEVQAQRRHNGTSPPYYKIGRKIIHQGSDLNAYFEARKFPQAG